jgi:hypothetical protein
MVMVGMNPAWKVRFSIEHVKSGSEAHSPHIEENQQKSTRTVMFTRNETPF